MAFEVSYTLDNEQQFWDELDDIVSTHCDSHELIDNTLRAYLQFTANFKAEYLNSENAIALCSHKLFHSELFQAHKDYVRRQMVHGLLQEDDASTIHLIAAFLIFDGRNNELTLEMMKEEEVFPRLIELAQEGRDDNMGLYHLLLELIYEMSRIQRLSWGDLSSVDDAFILSLFQKIEQVSDNVDDPYHYLVIRVLLVLNEQYLVFSTSSSAAHGSDPNHVSLTNRVIKTLATQGHRYKTFGENLILLLNRESETSCQLLILKLLYLLFSSPATAEYFYTNDLRVLLDVILRNLLDLPADSGPAAALRHTYLRVLHPLLSNSQLAHPPYYKRAEVRRLLELLLDANAGAGKHFAPVDPTTVRLVRRCVEVPWLREPDDESSGDKGSPDSGRKGVAKRLLGMSVPQAGESALSVMEVAAHKEKPGVLTPSKGNDRRKVL